MKEKVCGVTGHREIPAEYMEQAEQGLRREIEKAIADGYTYFISGFADGADQLFAGIVLEKVKENPALRLEAAIPYRNRYKRLMEDERTKAMLEACAKVEVISEEWASNVYMMFFVKYFSLKKASEFPFFSKGFSLPSAGIMHPCA